MDNLTAEALADAMYARNDAVVADNADALAGGEGGVILDPKRRCVGLGQGILWTNRNTQTAAVTTIRVENKDVLHEAPGVVRASGGAAPAGCAHQQGVHAAAGIDRRFLGLPRSARSESQPGEQSDHASRRGIVR